MNERGWMEPIVERVVGEVLDSHLAQLRIEIVRRIMEEVAAAAELAATSANQPPAAQPAASSVSPVDSIALARALSEIQAGTSQREILRALLDSSSRYAARVALFVVKGSRATGWQGRGFADCDAIKDFVLEESTPAIVCAIRDRVLTTAAAEDLDPRFMEQVGMAASGEAQILPLILKDKVAALLYADSGTESAGLLDVGSLELLVLSTGAWLEVNSLRKQAQKEPSASQADGSSAAEELPYRAPAPTPTAVAPAFNDPFATHAPAFSSGQAMAAAASSAEVSRPAGSDRVDATASTAWGVIAEVRSAPAATAAPPVETQSAYAEPVPAAPVSFPSAAMGTAEFEHSSSEAATTDTAAAVPTISPEDQEVHRKAQRFARLLVDEIKLYNQAKVTEGRNNKDLYDRLKEVIEKSRVTYQKRYGTTVAASGNYFEHEIIRSLAEDDISIMGAHFRH